MNRLKCSGVFLSLAAAGLLFVESSHAQNAMESELRESYTQGTKEALVQLALFYGQGKSDLGSSAEAVDRAFDLLTIASNRYNNPVAQVNLGVLYEYGDSVEVNYPRAAYWYNRAAIGGNQNALVKLGDLYSRGIGTEVNIERAFNLYAQAADAGMPAAQVELGYLYEMGDLGEVDYPSAVSWYEKAAQGGDEIGQYNLAEMYELGKGVEINLEKARVFYGMAAQQGLQEAAEALQRIK